MTGEAKAPESSDMERSTLMPSGGPSANDLINSVRHSDQEEFLLDLSDHEVLGLPYLFEFWALPHQVPPKGDWHAWVVMGGRGAGKTRAGSEWVRSIVEGSRSEMPGQAKNIALIGETFDQAREVMVYGDSGILACSPPDRRPDWIASRKLLRWPNGAEARIYSAQDPEGLRGPQFDAAWVDELGCGAIDKGTNQPNKFLDPKSSESALPHWSNGQRDDLIQAQYLKAMHGHFADPANNPTHVGSGVQMVDMSKALVWAWDVRPWPAFPGRPEIWSDGDNYTAGHWITGRASARPLTSVVSEICARAGVHSIDTSELFGLVRGYAVADVTTARSALQPLMTTYGFDAVERDGVLRFVSRSGRSDAEQPEAQLAITDEIAGTVERSRAAEAEAVGRIRLGFVEADASYEVAAAEAALSDDPSQGIADSDVPLVLTRAEGQQIVERWLAEARVSRDTARFALPPSRSDIGAGDVVTLDDGRRYRIDRLDQGTERLADAVQVEPETYVPQAVEVPPTPLRVQAAAAAPVEALFMDLPLLTGDEVPHAPHVAMVAEPWQGTVALHSAPQDSDYEVNRLIDTASIVGRTETDMSPAQAGVWDHGPALRVRLVSGALLSRAPADVLAGANVAAIGDGTAEGWEIFQFADAQPVGPGLWDLRVRLRGQAGTDVAADTTWPVGSYFVLMDGAPAQMTLAPNARGVERHLRWGPASRALGDPSYRYRVESFRGVGLRPYPVAHLHAFATASGTEVTWIRRTRTGGDSWDGSEVPLGEATESYLVRVVDGGSVLREAVVSTSSWSYSSGEQAADGPSAQAMIEVAQISDTFGPGPVRQIALP